MDTLLPNMFHSSCIGFDISNFNVLNVNQQLEVCNKCHNWAAGSAVYVLSCYKFLSYSAVTYNRRISWAGCVMLFTFYLGDTTNDLKKGLFLNDLILQVITLLDIINLVTFKLEDNKATVHDNHSFFLNIIKMVVLCTVIVFLKLRVPIQLHYYGYLMYLMTCVICGFMVDIWEKRLPPLSEVTLSLSENSSIDGFKKSE